MSSANGHRWWICRACRAIRRQSTVSWRKSDAPCRAAVRNSSLVNTACVPEIGKALAVSGLPLITLVHELASSFSYADFKTIYDSSLKVVYPAAFVRTEAHREFPLQIAKTAILPQGLLKPEFGSKPDGRMRASLLEEIGAPPGAFIVLGCGTLDLRKGIDVFVKVASAAIKSRRRDGAVRAFAFRLAWIRRDSQALAILVCSTGYRPARRSATMSILSARWRIPSRTSSRQTASSSRRAWIRSRA